MNRASSLIITITVAFFLVFLGMRLPSLQGPGKPKPRPRAVVKPAPKANLLAAEIKYPDHHEPGFQAAAVSPLPVPVAERLPSDSPLHSHSAIPGSPPTGRSPPLC